MATPEIRRAILAGSVLCILWAALSDRQHNLFSDYISQLVVGAHGVFAAAGILGMGVGTALTALHVHRAMAPGWMRRAAVASLCVVALLVPATLLMPLHDPDDGTVWTNLHILVADAAFVAGAAATVFTAWHHRRTRADGLPLVRWSIAVVATVIALASASAAVRLFGSSIDVRGVMQWTMVLAAAGWLATLAGLRVHEPAPTPQPTH